MEEKQTNYTIMEGYELPSKGLIYDTKVDSHIELRAMTARDEMKRLSPSTTPLKTLADIIEGCMIEKPRIHVYDMCVGDYEFLLHKLRIVSYGADYQVSVECPYCGEVIETTAKLDELQVKEFDIDEFNANKTFILPDSGKTISIKVQTPRMLDATEAKSKELKKKMHGAEINFDLYARLLMVVDTVDEKKMNSVDMDYFINDLTARDLNKILNCSDKLNSLIGLDTALTITCPKCGEDATTFFRFGPEFFRPANI